MANEKLKKIQGSKIKPDPIHKEPRIHTDQTKHTTHIPENKYVKFLKPLTQTVNRLHGFILVYTPRNINVLFS
jgi:hypothetical protein